MWFYLLIPTCIRPRAAASRCCPTGGSKSDAGWTTVHTHAYAYIAQDSRVESSNRVERCFTADSCWISVEDMEGSGRCGGKKQIPLFSFLTPPDDAPSASTAANQRNAGSGLIYEKRRDFPASPPFGGDCGIFLSKDMHARLIVRCLRVIAKRAQRGCSLKSRAALERGTLYRV